MKKKYLILMVFFLLPIVSALDMCEKSNTIKTNCTLITPSLDCLPTYDYHIINNTGSEVSSGNLSLLYADIYSLNFTEPRGTYIIRLCDGSTREVIVTEGDDNMIIGFIILIPMLLGFLLIWGASSLSEEHTALRIFLFVFSFFSFLMSIQFALMSIVKFYDWPEMQEVLAYTSNWYIWIIVFVIFYIVLYIIITAMKIAKQEKDQRMQY